MALWLVAVLLLQAQAALRTHVLGPAHRHMEGAGSSSQAFARAHPNPHPNPHPTAPATAPATATVNARAQAHAQAHAETQAQARERAEHLHRLAHEHGEAHHHGFDLLVVPAAGEAALDAAAWLLLAMLLPLAAAFGWRAPRAATAAPATPGWALVECVHTPPRKPPRG